MKSLFLIIGAPGSGKTTNASLIAQMNSSIEHYSTGDLLRAEVESGSSLGQEIKSFIDNGNLVPLNIVISALLNTITNSESDYILVDGYPRSVEQMSELDKVLKDNTEIELKDVIEVVVSKSVAKDRILGRNRGADDTTEVFENRMKVFLEPIEDIRKFYKEKGIYHEVNGERSVEAISQDINKIIIDTIMEE